MNLKKKTSLTLSQKEAIHQLWNAEYPQNLAHSELVDFENYLKSLSEKSHILLLDNEKIVGWFFSFRRENEKWFAILLDSKLHKKGFGKRLLNEAKKEETILNGWVIDHSDNSKLNGKTYQSPLGFYEKNGFEVLKESRLESEKISAVKIKWERKSEIK